MKIEDKIKEVDNKIINLSLDLFNIRYHNKSNVLYQIKQDEINKYYEQKNELHKILKRIQIIEYLKNIICLKKGI